MAMSNETKLAVKAKIRLNEKPADIAEALGVGIQTVYGLQRIVRKEMEDDQIRKLHDLPQETIAHIVSEAKSKVVELPIAEEFDKVIDGAAGLKKLDCAFQTTMTGVLARFDEMLKADNLSLSDTVTISGAVSNAYEKVFAAGTNIHIGDNNSHSNNQLTIFKAKMGV